MYIKRFRYGICLFHFSTYIIVIFICKPYLYVKHSYTLSNRIKKYSFIIKMRISFDLREYIFD